MKAEQVVNYLLANTPGVAERVGSTTPRIHYNVSPERPVYPYVTITTLSSERAESPYSNPGYARARVEVSYFAKTAEEIMALAEAGRSGLARAGSSFNNGTPINSVTVYDIHTGTEVQTWVPEIEAFVHTAEYTVLHAE